MILVCVDDAGNPTAARTAVAVQESKLNSIAGELKVITDESRSHTILVGIVDAVGCVKASNIPATDATIRRRNRQIETIIAKEETVTP